MHFYNLPIFKISQSINATSNKQKQRNSRRLQSASVKDSLFYYCSITANDTFYLRKIKLEDGTLQEKQVKIQKGKIEEIFFCKQQVIIKTNSNKILHIQAEAIFSISQNSLIIQGQNHFNCTYLSSVLQNLSSSSLKFIKVEENLIMVRLFEQSMVFQKLTANSQRKWTISAWDLGYGRNDTIIDYQVKSQAVLGVDSQRQLVLAVVKILLQNGDEVYVLLQMLWNQLRYVSTQIYVCSSSHDSQNKQSRILFTIFSSLMIVVYTGQNFVVCKRLKEGIQVELILVVQHQILDIVTIQNYSYDQEIIAVCKNKNTTKIYIYNLDKMLNNLIAQPKIINCDKSSKGQVIGFVKLPTNNPLLVCTDHTYFLMPTMLTLYQIIATTQVQGEPEQIQEQVQLFLQKDTNNNQVQLLSFKSFYNMFKNTDHILKGIEELFSAQKMARIVQQFQYGIQRQVGCYKNDTSLCWNVLQRQYTVIFIYLLQFLHYLQNQLVQVKPSIVLSDCYLIQIQSAFQQFYTQRPMVEQQKIQSVIHSKIIELKQNLSSFLTLFSKTNQISSAQSSVYQYFQILKNLTMRQIIEFVVNQISLIDYLAFIIYYAALLPNKQIWGMGRSLLKKLIETRGDYPPLIGLLCGDINNSIRSYQELEFCKLLAMQQQKDMPQNLPSLKQTVVAIPYYLKKIGFRHLLSFVPDEYQKSKYDGNFIVINISKLSSHQTMQLISSQIIQIREKNYLFLKQENICRAIETMENEVKINFCMQNQCQVYTFSQKLKIVSQVFIHQINQRLKDKYRDRLQNLKNIKQRSQYDCRCLNNQLYQKIIQAKRFSLKKRKFNQSNHSKKQESHKQVSIIDTFYLNLLQLCEAFNLHGFVSYLRNNVIMKSSIISNLQNLNNLNISRISMAEKRDYSERNLSIFYITLFINMWNLYDKIIQSQQTNQIDFEEQLQNTSFAHSYLSILEFLSNSLDNYCIKQINKRQVQEVSAQKIKKSLLNKKGGIKFKNTTYNFDERVVLGNLRTELVLKIFRLTREWIFDFQELVLQSIFRQSKLSYKNKQALSYLIKTNKL